MAETAGAEGIEGGKYVGHRDLVSLSGSSPSTSLFLYQELQDEKFVVHSTKILHTTLSQSPLYHTGQGVQRGSIVWPLGI